MKSKHLTALACVFVSLSSNAYAQPTPKLVATSAGGAICKVLEAAVVGGEKEASAEEASSSSENSAPRAAVAEGRIANSLNAIEINIVLMGQHRCAPISHSISSSTYLLPALTCTTDRLRASIGGNRDTKIESCDRAKWMPISAEHPE
jgi:hypothetical protein